MKIEANTDNRKMSEEEKRLIESLSSLAALLGNSLFYYGRTVLNVTFDQYEEIEAAAAAQEDRIVFRSHRFILSRRRSRRLSQKPG